MDICLSTHRFVPNKVPLLYYLTQIPEYTNNDTSTPSTKGFHSPRSEPLNNPDRFLL